MTTRMSIPDADVDVALPNASLLAYLGNPAATSETRDHSSLPREKTSSAEAYDQSCSPTDYDDESRYGFWGELDGTKNLSEMNPSYSNRRPVMRAVTTFCCLCGVIAGMILGYFSIYFAVHLAFSHYGLGTGMAEWIMYRHQLPPSTSYGIRFCLEPPNREAPRPQAWRYMKAGTDDRCTTDTIDFILNYKETWKVQPGASLVLRNREPYLNWIRQIQAP